MRETKLLNGLWAFAPCPPGDSPADAVANCRFESQPMQIPSNWKWKTMGERAYQP